MTTKMGGIAFGFKQAQQEKCDQGGGEGEEGVGHSHSHRIQESSIITGQQTHDDAKGSSGEDHAESHDQRCPASV